MKIEINTRVFKALATFCACMGVVLMSSACTTMALADASRVTASDYAQTGRIIGGIALIIVSAVLTYAASVHTNGQ